MSEIEAVLQNNPEHQEALRMRGSLALAKKNVTQVIADARSLLSDNPTSPYALRLLARGHLLNKEPNLAREALAKAVKANPTDTASQLELGRMQ